MEMLYDAGFGNPAVACERARTTIGLALAATPVRFVNLVNAGVTQYRVERPDVAEQTLRTALAYSAKYDYLAGRVCAGVTLARLYWSTERLDESYEYFQRTTEPVTDYPGQELNVLHWIVGARLAVARREYGLAAEYIRRARVFPYARILLHKLWLRCCEIDLGLATGAEMVSDAELRELLELHRRARGLGLHDEVMATLLNCLDAKGRSEEATALLQAYLREHRRDGFPVPSWLAGRCDAFSERQPLSMA
jgi:tetratricopeptide (TPR) repeat protein